MNLARYNHTATLLSNGKVLVAGGWDGTNYVTSAELYDPNTGKWTRTGSMTTNRSYHTATMLPTGKVLVVGGYGNESPYNLFSAELFPSPATGTWTNTGFTAFSRVSHTATLLRDGRVLVTGGTGSGNTAELYDPISGTWTNTGGMGRARWHHTATLLTNGNVLVAGGDYNFLPAGVFPTAEVYSPLTGSWTSTTPMTTNRDSASATLLPDGRVLVAGGWLTAEVQTNPPAYSSFSLASAELFDPMTGNWTATTNTMTTGRNDHTASLLPNGQVLLAGGFQNGPGDRDSLESFDPVTSGWITITTKLNRARSHHTATVLPSGGILAVGGFSRNSVTNTTEVYEYSDGGWANAGPMKTARSGILQTYCPMERYLLAGGSTSGGAATSSAELYDPAARTNTPTASMRAARVGHATVLLPTGKVLVAGGQFSLTLLSSTEIYARLAGAGAPTVR